MYTGTQHIIFMYSAVNPVFSHSLYDMLTALEVATLNDVNVNNDGTDRIYLYILVYKSNFLDVKMA